MNNTAQTLAFAATLGVVCSTLLVTTSVFTGPYQEANQKAEQVLNYLQALDAPLPEDAGAAELIALFEKTVVRKEKDGLELYEYRPEGAPQPQAVAVAFAGPGVWGPIEGVLALEPDMLTIRGVRFYRQEETPGLGGEIASDNFLIRFVGKQIVNAEGIAGFRIGQPGRADEQNSVDGITGATMTSDRVERMLDSLAKRIRED